jgi:hypothetical protein
MGWPYTGACQAPPPSLLFLLAACQNCASLAMTAVRGWDLLGFAGKHIRPEASLALRTKPPPSPVSLSPGCAALRLAMHE